MSSLDKEERTCQYPNRVFVPSLKREGWLKTAFDKLLKLKFKRWLPSRKWALSLEFMLSILEKKMIHYTLKRNSKRSCNLWQSNSSQHTCLNLNSLKGVTGIARPVQIQKPLPGSVDARVEVVNRLCKTLTTSPSEKVWFSNIIDSLNLEYKTYLIK